MPGQGERLADRAAFAYRLCFEPYSQPISLEGTAPGLSPLPRLHRLTPAAAEVVIHEGPSFLTARRTLPMKSVNWAGVLLFMS